jgi:hypothetical protein
MAGQFDVARSLNREAIPTDVESGGRRDILLVFFWFAVARTPHHVTIALAA